MTARDEILQAARDLAARSSGDSFTVAVVLQELRRHRLRYAESTIRTHVTSWMCVNAPDHHAVTPNDLLGVAPGRYRLRH